MLAESQWWPQAQLDAWQRQHLQLLLNHARATSPFYRFRLNRVFRSDGGIDWDRWHEIPILTRAQLWEHSIRSVEPPVPAHGAFVDVQSSGSTGHPVTVRSSAWLREMSLALNWRAHIWSGLDWSRNVLATMGTDDRRTDGQSLGPWGPPGTRARNAAS